jgi:hypothetical protein
MRKLYIPVSCVAILLAQGCTACPTCVGRVTKQSASFFSDECYVSKKQSKEENKLTGNTTETHKGDNHENNQ